MHLNEIPAAPSPHRVQNRISPVAWEALKERYLGGEDAIRLAETFCVSLSTVRTRARREGWRRADGPAPEIAAPPTLDELASDSRPNFSVMADTAMRRAAHAVREGQLHDALGWTRVGRSLTAAARRERSANGG